MILGGCMNESVERVMMMIWNDRGVVRYTGLLPGLGLRLFSV